MKLAASQIAWTPEEEPNALGLLKQYGFCAIETVPSRMQAGEAPYNAPQLAEKYAATMAAEHGLALCSMQGMWFGQSGSMFGKERAQLLEYTRKGILFAAAGGIGNLVFGNPKNRVLPAGQDGSTAVDFFKQLGDFAAENGTVLALEANAAIYGTNFINETPEAFAMAERVDSLGCRVNLDTGTMIANQEKPACIAGKVYRINHVHISEPMLVQVQKRSLHKELYLMLKNEGYDRYISLEMKAQGLEVLERTLEYVAEVFA
ncbi:MAG: sugar phosphate isomerase/epimerase family protein [Oscillospiraceae bacterium]